MTRTIPRTYTYTVLGHGRFPIDMLRYDRSRPHTENDSAKIERSFTPRDRQERLVKLSGPIAPNEARWGSFGWAVESVE